MEKSSSKKSNCRKKIQYATFMLKLNGQGCETTYVDLKKETFLTIGLKGVVKNGADQTKGGNQLII